MDASPLIFAGSPRRGHSLDIARIAAESMASVAGTGLGHGAEQGLGLGFGVSLTSFDPVALASLKINPCINCGVCEKPCPPGASCEPCPQGVGDDSAVLFNRLMEAPLALICAPVYFYHLPAQLKAVVDRCQFHYRRKEAGDARLNSLPKRPAYVILHAGRPHGEKLFEGSLLSLKYALDVFNLELAEPLLLRGTDAPDSVLSRPETLERIKAYAAGAGQPEKTEPAGWRDGVYEGGM